ncbi:MAG: hypothetical protein MUC42_06260 [Bryobacter sp.]|jgi:hypothetical protein|nr:hypothetical protein [Bryobacter sp.]
MSVMRMTPEEYQRRQAARAKPAGMEACASFSRLYTAEADVLKAVLATLEMHPKVAWVARMNSGAFQIEGRFIKVGFKGCSDILGMLKGGRMLAVECKSSKGKESADQAAFGERVARDGGLYFVARSVDDVIAALS